MIKEKMSDIIIRLRSKRNWSQEKLAEEADVAYHTVFRAEAGNNISVKSIQKIARALDISVSVLMNEQKNNVQETSSQDKAQLILNIQSLLNNLSQDDLETLKTTAENLLKLSQVKKSQKSS